jgi:hypothetical protein
MFGALNRLIRRHARRPDAKLLALTLNNMTQGVVLFDTGGRPRDFRGQSADTRLHLLGRHPRRHY